MPGINTTRKSRVRAAGVRPSALLLLLLQLAVRGVTARIPMPVNPMQTRRALMAAASSARCAIYSGFTCIMYTSTSILLFAFRLFFLITFGRTFHFVCCCPGVKLVLYTCTRSTRPMTCPRPRPPQPAASPDRFPGHRS